MVGAELTGWMNVVMVILGGVVFCVVTLFIAYLAWKSSERVQSEPRYHRVVMFVLGALYLFLGLDGIYSVVTGKLPVWNLVFLLIPSLFGWKYFRAASRIKVPPKLCFGGSLI